MDSDACSSILRLNIGGNEFLTTVDTLTLREPESMLAAMFSGRHTVNKDPEKGYVFIDRDGKHFRHILNWLRGGVARSLSELERLDLLELLEEAEYYQLLGLVEKINEALNKKKDEQMDSNAFSSIVRLSIGGHEFCTTVDALTQREPQSMLAAMFSGRHTIYKDPEKGHVFVDRDGMHFRHILNWLRDGVAPSLSESEYSELLREAEYYQLLGLVDKINEVLTKKKEDEQVDAEFTRGDIIRCVQSSRHSFRGVNISGLDLSKLDLSNMDFIYACLKNVNFSLAYFYKASFQYADAEKAIFDKAAFYRCYFTGANLRGARMAGANLQLAKLQKADLQHANLESADLKNADLEEANLEGANLKGANFTKANLKGANLRYANLQDALLEGANLTGADLLGTIR